MDHQCSGEVEEHNGHDNGRHCQNRNGITIENIKKEKIGKDGNNYSWKESNGNEKDNANGNNYIIWKSWSTKDYYQNAYQ